MPDVCRGVRFGACMLVSLQGAAHKYPLLFGVWVEVDARSCETVATD